MRSIGDRRQEGRAAADHDSPTARPSGWSARNRPRAFGGAGEVAPRWPRARAGSRAARRGPAPALPTGPAASRPNSTGTERPAPSGGSRPGAIWQASTFSQPSAAIQNSRAQRISQRHGRHPHPPERQPLRPAQHDHRPARPPGSPPRTAPPRSASSGRNSCPPAAARPAPTPRPVGNSPTMAPTSAAAIADLQRGEQIRHRRRQPQLPERLRRGWHIGAQQVQLHRVRAAQPLHHAHDHRKERQIGRDHRLGHQPLHRRPN